MIKEYGPYSTADGWDAEILIETEGVLSHGLEQCRFITGQKLKVTDPYGDVFYEGDYKEVHKVFEDISDGSSCTFSWTGYECD